MVSEDELIKTKKRKEKKRKKSSFSQNIKRQINRKFEELKKFFSSYFFGKYRILFLVSLVTIFVDLISNYFPNSIIMKIISYLVSFAFLFFIFILSYFIFLNKKIELKEVLKASLFFLLNVFSSFLILLLFLITVTYPLYSSISKYANLPTYTYQDILKMKQMALVYSLFYPIFLIIFFALFYVFFNMFFFSTYYYLSFKFWKGIKKLWRDIFSLKNFLFFWFFLILGIFLYYLSKINFLFSYLQFLLIFPIIRYFIYIRETKKGQDLILLFILTLIFGIFAFFVYKIIF